jgi:hypothetical protein
VANAVGGCGVDADCDAKECRGDGDGVGENDIEAAVVVYVACWEVFYWDALVGRAAVNWKSVFWVASCGFIELNLRDVEREHADCDIVEEVFHSGG